MSHSVYGHASDSEPWPTASCCGEPRVTPEVDCCYDHARACHGCGQPAVGPLCQDCGG
jgi:hypothetical protein